MPECHSNPLAERIKARLTRRMCVQTERTWRLTVESRCASFEADRPHSRGSFIGRRRCLLPLRSDARLVDAGVPSVYRSRTLQKGGDASMEKQQVVSKILELISRLEEIKSKEGKRAGKVANIQESVDELQGLLNKLQPVGKRVDALQFLVTVYKVAERLYSWMSEKEE